MSHAAKERVFKALNEPNGLTRYLCRRLAFGACERLGVHVTADHFYETIPNTRQVAAEYQDKPRSCRGIELKSADAEERLCSMLTAFGSEFDEQAARHGYTFGGGTYFRSLDAITLYSVVRTLKPARIVEVGQGYSTRVLLAAMDRNAAETGRRTHFVTIDPFERIRLGHSACGFAEVEEHRARVQDVNPAVFTSLRSGDLLFLDSTHCYKFGSDVEHNLESAIPSVPNGVVVHLHDIFTPYQYPKAWFVRERRFWNEQYMLEMFLRFNNCFEVWLPVYLLGRTSARLAALFRDSPSLHHHPVWGVSFYVRRWA